MTNTDDDQRTPTKLIYEALEHAADERERVSAAPHVPDKVLNTVRCEIEYHAAVMEFFNRLKPHLPDRPDYWNNTPLWTEPMDGKKTRACEAVGDLYGLENHEVAELFEGLEASEEFPEIEPQDELVRGLRHLVHWRGRTETVERTTYDVIEGEDTVTVEQPIHLPQSIAMRVHDVLEDAAADLGYNVRPGKDIVQTELDPETGESTVTGVTNG